MSKMNIFRKRLAEQRMACNMSYQSLGDRLGLSAVAVLKWEKRISQPSLSNFMLLCEVLDVSADYMLGISEYK